MKQSTEPSPARRCTVNYVSETCSPQLGTKSPAGDRFDPSTLHQHAPVLLVYAVRRLRDRTLAEDVVLGHAAEDVSAMLGISPANVWVTRHRARKSLRISLESARPV